MYVIKNIYPSKMKSECIYRGFERRKEEEKKRRREEENKRTREQENKMSETHAAEERRRTTTTATTKLTVRDIIASGSRTGNPPQKMRVIASEFKIVASRSGNSNSPPSYNRFISPCVGAS